MRYAGKSKMNVTNLEIDILKMLDLAEPLTFIRSRTNQSYQALNHSLFRLIEKGLIQRKSRGEYELTRKAYQLLDFIEL